MSPERSEIAKFTRNREIFTEDNDIFIVDNEKLMLRCGI